MARAHERLDSPFRAVGPSAPARSPELTAAPAKPTSTAMRLPLRRLTGWEEEYVERHLGEANTARLCNELLARCLVPPGEDPGAAREQIRALLVAERDRALVQLRQQSLGGHVEARLRCPACGEAFEVGFSLAELSTDFAVPEGPLELVLGDGTPLVLRLPTAGDQEAMLDEQLELEAERRSWLLGRLVTRHGDRTEGLGADFARDLTVTDRHALEAELEARLPDFDLSMAVSCPVCSTQFSAPFDVADFFLKS